MSETSRMGSGRVFPALPAHTDPEAPFAATWWGNAWIRALEEAALDQARLSRGRAYAREGSVDTITVAPGRIVAYVHGSRPRPYRAELRLRTLTPEDWTRFLDVVAADPAHIAALLDKDMPQALAAAATRAGVELLPAGRELAPSCSCPDRGHPCKHAAALAYQTARLLDADPFVLFLLRGGEEADLLDELAHRNAQETAREEREARTGGGGTTRPRDLEAPPHLTAPTPPPGSPEAATPPAPTETPEPERTTRTTATEPATRTATAIEPTAPTGPAAQPASDRYRYQHQARNEQPHPTDPSLPAPAPAPAPASAPAPAPASAPPLPSTLAREALATTYRPPLPPPPAPPSRPGAPPVLPATLGAPDPTALEFLVTDTAVRAHAYLMTGADPFPSAMEPWHDAVRLAASHPGLTGRRTFSRQFTDLADSVDRTPKELARAAAAWRQGAEDGLATLESPWDPPAGPFDRARGALVAADLPRMAIHRNHLTNAEGTLQLRYGQDGRWYPYRSEPGGDDWWPEGEADVDPVGALAGVLEG